MTAVRSLTIALDYDRTFTDDKSLFTGFAMVAKASGHKVSFVTFRDGEDHWGNQDIEADAEKLGIPIVYTAGGQKADYFKADIWIDDMPILIPSKDMLLMSGLGQ